MRRLAKYFGLLVVPLLILGAGCNNTNPASTTSTEIEEEEVKIGVVAPMSGDYANYGQNLMAAAQIAVDELNSDDKNNGKKYTLIAEDGECDPKSATNAGTKLISTDKVKAILGGFCSGETLAIAPLAEKAGVPIISPASSNPSITTAGDYIFRFMPSDNFQGDVAAKYMVEELGKKNIAVLHIQSDYGLGIKDVFEKKVPDYGGKIVASETFQPNTKDLRAQITKIKSANPDAVYFVGMSAEVIPGLKQIKDLGLDVPIVGSDSMDDSKIPTEAGKASDGVRFFYPANATLPDTFKTKMKEKVGTDEIIYFSPRAYDIIQTFGRIIDQVGSEGAKIKDELYKVKDYKGIGDTYTLDSNGDVTTANYGIKEFKDGKVNVIK